MRSFRVHTFLVHPGKNQDPAPAISGKEVNNAGKLTDLLLRIYQAQPEPRDFEITFRHAADGTKQNDCRDLLLAYQAKPSLEAGLAIATRLQSVTDRRSGMGLLFVMTGQHGTKFRTVISRFPANEGILAEVDASGLDVEFLEQVFIKQMSAYKSILVEDQHPPSLYWSGFATDRQAGAAPENISSYWIDDFLNADFAETPKAGTRRLADALRKAVKANPDLLIKEEIAAAVSLAEPIFKGKSLSIEEFCKHFGLSKQSTDSIINQLPKSSLAKKKFKFDVDEFKKTVPYRSVEMKNGAILTAPAGEFESVFDMTQEKNGNVRYSTVSKISDQRITKR